MTNHPFATEPSGDNHAPGIVCVLTKPAMPGMVKIGRTSQSDARARPDQLYTTGVPVPFGLVFACMVSDPEWLGRALHVAFAPQRVNSRREFFCIKLGQALAILELLRVEDVTQAVEGQHSDVTAQERNAT